MDLPRRTSRVYKYLQTYIEQHGYAPSLREIMDGAGISSTSVVNYHLNRLVVLGLIRRDSGKARAIRVLGRCPVCGRWVDKGM